MVPEGYGVSSLDVGEIGTHHQTVRHRFRPLFGGLQSEGDDWGLCTYGFNAIRSDVKGFVETVDGSKFSCTVWWQEYDCRKTVSERSALEYAPTFR